MPKAYYNENDPHAAAWLRNLVATGLIAPGDVDERSIKEVQPADISGYTQHHFFAGIGGWSLALRLAGWSDDRPVWTGSCPCQPFSAAGARRGTADERHLWPAFYRLIAECRPSTVFGEQVASSDGREWLAGVRADLEGLGYAVGAADLCAAGSGAPHIRQRLFWVADAERRPAEPRGLADEPREGAGAPPPGASVEPGRCGVPGRLADSDGGLAGDGGLQRGGEHGQKPQDGGAGGVGDADQAGRSLEPERDGATRREQDGERRMDADGSRLASFWSASGLIPCSDGKARRVPQSVFQRMADGFPGGMDELPPAAGFPLARGVEGRTGALRGFGNAIVPQVAAAFIRSCGQRGVMVE